MAELGPLTVTAHNREQAEYLVRSRAEQRGVSVSEIDVVSAGAGRWLVTLTVTDAPKAESARLADDSQVLHLGIHGRHRNAG